MLNLDDLLNPVLWLMSRELCVLPCWLLSSILWDSIWRASDRAPCRCVHYLWEEEEQTEFILCLRYVFLWIYRRLRVCVYALRNPPACSKTASEPSHQSASALPFVLRVSPRFFTSLSSLNLRWSDAFHELLIWQLRLSYDEEPKKIQSLSGRTTRYYDVCGIFPWRQFWFY